MRGGHFRAAPSPVSPYFLVQDFAAAIALDAAEVRFAAPDDAPLTATQIPALRQALDDAAKARFAMAAATLVAFAASDPYAPESGWALRRAHLYWRALGRDADARATLRRYESDQAAREPRAAAEFFWSRRLGVPAGLPRRAYLREYLNHHAMHGPPDLQIVAEAELAADLWRAACARPWHGLCADFVWTTRRACSFSKVPIFTVNLRDPMLRREALRLSASAVRRGRSLDLTRVAPWRRTALRAAIGEAALVTADDTLEALFALEFPLDLDFSVEDYKHNSGVPTWEQEYRAQLHRRDQAMARLMHYTDAYIRRFSLATRAVEAVGATRSGPAILTVLARTALAYNKLQDDREYDNTSTAPLPNFSCCYVDRPLREAAETLLDACVDLVRTRNSFAPDVDVCFDGFGHLSGEADMLTEFAGLIVEPAPAGL